MTSLPDGAVRRCAMLVNPFHSAHYFAPETRQELTALGLKDQGVYFAGRSAAFGRVGAGVVTASFHNFKPELVARYVPAVWEVTSPQDVLDARLRAVDALLRRLLGEDALASAELAEAATLALRATEGCRPEGRALYAALAELPVPTEPHLAYWHATTLLREHRGDGHIAVLLGAGLDPVEALVAHAATGKGMSEKWNRDLRGWSAEELEAGRQRLRERGLMDEGGALTEAGAALREELEQRTDELDRGPYEHLGAAGTARLTELAHRFTTTVVEAGAFPADLRG
ncbi:hypothetical protein [Streptomyces sp. NPDC049555]|uniref:SCO6745 family protein n=1 Tax=unclassified Streptomyces TaxID=2593676 RepID=UPI00341FA7E5